MHERECGSARPLLGTLRGPRRDVYATALPGSARGRRQAPVRAQPRGAGGACPDGWIFSDAFPQRLRLEIDPHSYGELPRTYFYSSDHSHHAVSGKLSTEQVERWICEQRLGPGAEHGLQPGASGC
jgi:hypothetical protein